MVSDRIRRTRCFPLIPRRFSSAKINLAPFNKIFCCLLYGNNETPAMTLEIANDVCGRGSVRPRFSDVVRQLFRVANTSGKSNTQGASFTCKLFGRVLVVVTRRWLASWRDLSRWVVCRAKKETPNSTRPVRRFESWSQFVRRLRRPCPSSARAGTRTSVPCSCRP